jgi:hypothetical protein
MYLSFFIYIPNGSAAISCNTDAKSAVIVDSRNSNPPLLLRNRFQIGFSLPLLDNNFARFDLCLLELRHQASRGPTAILKFAAICFNHSARMASDFHFACRSGPRFRR